MPARDIQQRDGPGQHLAVSGVSCWDVLCGTGAGGAERELQRGLLLHWGVCGGERERVRCASAVQRVELWRMWRSVSCGLLLSAGVRRSDGVWQGAVLRDGWALAGERAV